jgi:hypothetical protein
MFQHSAQFGTNRKTSTYLGMEDAAFVPCSSTLLSLVQIDKPHTRSSTKNIWNVLVLLLDHQNNVCSCLNHPMRLTTTTWSVLRRERGAIHAHNTTTIGALNSLVMSQQQQQQRGARLKQDAGWLYLLTFFCHHDRHL